MRVAVTGGRDFSNKEMATRAFDALLNQSEKHTIVCGGSKGADMLCFEIATKLSYKTERYLPNWNKYGKAAGPIRNREMMSSNIDLLIAFPGGKGTENCINLAKSMGIPIYYADTGLWDKPIWLQ